MGNQKGTTAERRGILDGESSRRCFLKAATAVAASGLSLLTFPGRGATASTEDMSALTTMNATDKGYWNHVRSQFVLDPQITHLNTGTEGAMPREVIKALNRYLIEFASNPMQAAALSADFSYFQQANRERVAAFTGARPTELVLTTNTTEGMNVVIHGLNLNAGDEVITTFHDHSAGLSPLQVFRDRRGIIVKQLTLPSPASSKEELVALFRDAITANTKAICFCHINYTTGLRMPVKELCDLARSYGLISIVDGAHALGMLELDLHDLGCDFYSCAGHKWLNAPPGTGVLYIRDGENNPFKVWPMLTELYGYPGPVTVLLQVAGQQNTPAIKAMGNAMDLQDAIGKTRIEERVLELSGYLKAKVLEQWGRENLLTPVQTDLSTGIAAFVPFADFADRYNSAKISRAVTAVREQYKIYIRSVNFQDRPGDTKKTNALRVSTHIFNSFSDIDNLMSALKEVTASMSGKAVFSVRGFGEEALEFMN